MTAAIVILVCGIILYFVLGKLRYNKLKILVLVLTILSIIACFLVDIYNVPAFDVKLRLYAGLEDYTDYPLDESLPLLKDPNFDKDRPTVVYIHGFKERNTDRSILTVVGAYLERRDHNVILVDWSINCRGSYIFNAIPKAIQVGKHVGRVLSNFVDEGVSLPLIHVVGHSLGGHIAGYIGRETKANNKLLRRLTLLDPAFPLFYPNIFFTHTSADDAQMVDVIHTDGWVYGPPFATGSVDFYPNGGKALQPGCPWRIALTQTNDDFCSHWRSWEFYAETVTNANAMQAVKCPSYSEFQKGDCNNNDKTYMGFAVSDNATGEYYLDTTDKTPFGKGDISTKT